MLLSVVIPAYNEVCNLPETLPGVCRVLDQLAQEEPLKYEILIVDDHSEDRTFQLARDLGDPRIRAMRLSKRSGSHVAIQAGLTQVTGDLVLCLAADGQDDPEVLREMLAKWRAGANVVWAQRQSREHEPLSYRMFARVFYWLLKMSTDSGNLTVDPSRAMFFLLDRKVVDALNNCREHRSSLLGLVHWVGFKQDSVDFVRRQRRHGKSKWNFRSRLRLALDWIMGFSALPLRLCSLLGLVLVILGVLRAFLFGQPTTGWASLIMAILVLGGVQIIMLGVLGEYLWRTLVEARKRPGFFIESTTWEQNGRGPGADV